MVKILKQCLARKLCLSDNLHVIICHMALMVVKELSDATLSTPWDHPK